MEKKYKMNYITSKQWFQIISGIVSGLITSAALLTTLLGQNLALKVVAVLGILNVIISSVGTSISGQGATVKEVLAMPGVDNIDVNEKANSVLTAIAVDPNVSKISLTPTAKIAVDATKEAR
jgi:hypothetical protein